MEAAGVAIQSSDSFRKLLISAINIISATVAQLVEQLFRKQWVGGSIPLGGFSSI